MEATPMEAYGNTRGHMGTALLRESPTENTRGRFRTAGNALPIIRCFERGEKLPLFLSINTTHTAYSTGKSSFDSKPEAFPYKFAVTDVFFARKAEKQGKTAEFRTKNVRNRKNVRKSSTFTVRTGSFSHKLETLKCASSFSHKLETLKCGGGVSAVTDDSLMQTHRAEEHGCRKAANGTSSRTNVKNDNREERI